MPAEVCRLSLPTSFALRLTDKFLGAKERIDLIERIPTKEEWRLILKALEQWEDAQAQVRLRFILSMLFYTGMRISELANLTWSAFHHSQSGWSIYLIGKGGKPWEPESTPGLFKGT